MQLFYPKIAALGYPADVVTNGHAGVLWVFDISEKNQMSVMRALKTHEADIEEHWIDVGWWASACLHSSQLCFWLLTVRCHGCCMLSLCPLPFTLDIADSVMPDCLFALVKNSSASGWPCS